MATRKGSTSKASNANATSNVANTATAPTGHNVPANMAAAAARVPAVIARIAAQAANGLPPKYLRPAKAVAHMQHLAANGGSVASVLLGRISAPLHAGTVLLPHIVPTGALAPPRAAGMAAYRHLAANGGQVTLGQYYPQYALAVASAIVGIPYQGVSLPKVALAGKGVNYAPYYRHILPALQAGQLAPGHAHGAVYLVCVAHHIAGYVNGTMLGLGLLKTA